MQKTFIALFALGLLAAAPFAQAAGTDRIGVVDAQSILAQSEAGKAVQAQLKAFGAQQAAALKSQEAKLKKEHDAIEKNASIQTEAAQKQAQAEFQKKFQAYQADAQKRQQAFDKKREELITPLQAKLFNVIHDYAVRNGYELILDKGAAIYNKDSLDLTDQILKAFEKTEAQAAAKGK